MLFSIRRTIDMKKATTFVALLILLTTFALPLSANPSGSAAGTFYQNVMLSEWIGEKGARQWAQSKGWSPLYLGKTGIPQGLDQVYQSSDDIIHVVEAKGGNSPIGKAYGFNQGTAEWAVQSAKRMLNSTSASSGQKKAAKKTLKAVRNGNMNIHTVRSLHHKGVLQKTRLEKTAGTTAMAKYLAGGSAMPEVWANVLYWGALALSVTDGIYRIVRAKNIEEKYEQGKFEQDQRVKKHLTNVNTYFAGWTGWYAGSLLGAQVGTMIQPVTGTVLGSLIFSVVGYLAGYLLIKKATDVVYEHRDRIADYFNRVGTRSWNWMNQSTSSVSFYYSSLTSDLDQASGHVEENIRKAIPYTKRFATESYQKLESGARRSNNAIQEAGQRVIEYGDSSYSTISDWAQSWTSESDESGNNDSDQ